MIFFLQECNVTTPRRATTAGPALPATPETGPGEGVAVTGLDVTVSPVTPASNAKTLVTDTGVDLALLAIQVRSTFFLNDPPHE